MTISEILISIPIIGWILESFFSIRKNINELSEVKLNKSKTPTIKEQIKEDIEYYKNNNMYGFGEPIENKEENLKVEIKDSMLDINKIKEYKGEEVKKFEFRPQKWEQFIGQEEAKRLAQKFKKKIEREYEAEKFALNLIKKYYPKILKKLLCKVAAIFYFLFYIF